MSEEVKDFNPDLTHWDARAPFYLWDSKVNEFWAFTPNMITLRVSKEGVNHLNTRAIIKTAYTDSLQLFQLAAGMLKRKDVNLIKPERFWSVFATVYEALIPTDIFGPNGAIEQPLNDDQVKPFKPQKNEYQPNVSRPQSRG